MRSFEYELKHIKKFSFGMIAVTSLVIVASILGNLLYGSNNAMGNMVFGQGGHTYVSVVQTSLIFIAIGIIISRFTFIDRSISLNISMSITRGEFFKTLVLENLLVSGIISLFLSLVLKLEPLFIDQVLKDKPGYSYLSKLGKLDILVDGFFSIFLNVFLVFLVVIVLWTLVAILFRIFGWTLCFWIFGLNIILEIPLLKPLKSMVEFFSIDNLIDGVEDFGLGFLGIFKILILYLITYLLLKNIDLGGE